MDFARTPHGSLRHARLTVTGLEATTRGDGERHDDHARRPDRRPTFARSCAAPTEDERAAAAHKLCRRMDTDLSDDRARTAAHDVLRLMASDAAELVRRDPGR